MLILPILCFYYAVVVADTKLNEEGDAIMLLHKKRYIIMIMIARLKSSQHRAMQLVVLDHALNLRIHH